MKEASNECDNVSDVTNIRTCPLNLYDCRDGQFSESSLQEHYISEKHQKTVVRYVKQNVESTNDDYSKAALDSEEGSVPLRESYKRLSRIPNDIEAISDKLLQFDANKLQYHNKTLSLSQQTNDIHTRNSSEKALIDAISLNLNVLRQDIKALQQQIENNNEIIRQDLDGMVVWKIINFDEKRCDAQSERQPSIYSPPFYTSASGYKLCVRLYLNGDGSARGSHISIFLVILRGKYDAILIWPFSHRVSFCLCDQRTMIETNGATQPKHIIDSFRPDTTSVSFQRPCSFMNIASGIPKFCSLTEFDRPPNQNLYLVDDTIYIKILIDFIGYPRTMVPFIFNLNIALPVHIQQKLILEERTRRQEQNNT